MRTWASVKTSLLLGAAVIISACTSAAPAGGTAGATAAAPTLGPTEVASANAAVTEAPAASQTITTDPCVLVSKDEATGFLGSPVTDYQKSTSQALPGVTLTVCTFSSAAGTLAIGLARPFNWDLFLSSIPADIKKGLQPVSGIGDAAWFMGDPTQGAALLIRKGDAFVEVIEFLNSGASTEDLEKEAGQQALTRL